MNRFYRKAVIIGAITSIVGATTAVQAGEFFDDFGQVDGTNTTTPNIYLNNGGSGGGPNQDWALITNWLGTGEFSILDCAAGCSNSPFIIEAGAPENSIFTDSSGKVGLGTNTPGGFSGSRLTVGTDSFGNSSIYFPNTTQNYLLFNSNNNFGIFDATQFVVPFQLLKGAADGSLVVAGNSNVGVGTAAPTSKLHVADDVDAKILVENTSAIRKGRQLFELKAAGNPKFAVTSNANSTGSPVTWAFANPGTAFRLSRQGSGVVEFQVFNNGDATLAGTLTQNSDVNAKQDIEAVDHQTVLAKVMELPISEWSYKNAPSSRHIGPMAQDFYQYFELGNTDKGISSIDTGGVALAAIQAVKKEKDSEIAQLKAENKSLQAEKDGEIAALQAELQHQRVENEKRDERMIELEMALAEVLRNQTAEVQVGSTN